MTYGGRLEWIVVGAVGFPLVVGLLARIGFFKRDEHVRPVEPGATVPSFAQDEGVESDEPDPEGSDAGPAVA